MFDWWRGISGRSIRRAVRRGEWSSLISALEQRIGQLERDDLFIISVGNGYYRQIASHPTIVIHRLSMANLVGETDYFQITCNVQNPDGIGPEDAFLAWTVAGFQALENKRIPSYGTGHLLRKETQSALSAVLRILEETYRIDKHEELIVCGDDSLQSILVGTRGVIQLASNRFYWVSSLHGGLSISN